MTLAIKVKVGVSEAPLSVAAALDFVHSAENGAVDVFVGRVRNHNLGREVKAVSYDAFTVLAQRVFEEMCYEAIATIEPRARCYISHYKGRLDIGGLSVVIAVGSPHRDESFRACRYLIETLKQRAPIWKQEHYVDGDSEWVQGHALCSHHDAHDHHHDHHAPADVMAVVLLGGRSRRMGRDKARLAWQGMRLADYIADVAQQAGVKAVYASGASGFDLVGGRGEIADLAPDKGPLSGICSAILHFQPDGAANPGMQAPSALLFLPVDLPLLTPELLGQLFDALGHYRLSCHFAGHPLPCLIPLSAPVFALAKRFQEEMLAGRDCAVRDFLHALPTLTLPTLTLPLQMAEALTNTNYPAEWQAVLSRGAR